MRKQNQLIEDTDPRIIEYHVEHMGRRSSQKLLDKIGGDISNIEEMTRSEFTNIKGVGDKTAECIGIWDESGRPVKRISRNPCPVCGDSCEEFDILRGTSNISKSVGSGGICVGVSDGYNRGDKCVVKIGYHR